MAATISSAFGPAMDEKRWVSQGKNFIRSEVKIDIEVIPTIFEVSKEMKETMPEAYNPQHLGLGPYHHMRPEFHVTDRQKHAMVKKFLELNSLASCAENIVGKMKDLEQVIRGNYDKYLDVEGTTLEYIIAVDSLFLLTFLDYYCNAKKSSCFGDHRVQKMLVKDVVMLENQIPAVALRLIGKEVGMFHDGSSSNNNNNNNSNTELYANLFYEFCKAHSPLDLVNPSEKYDDDDGKHHLLAYMLYLIVNNHAPTRTKEEKPTMMKPLVSPIVKSTMMKNKIRQNREGKEESSMPGEEESSMPGEEESSMPGEVIREFEKELGGLQVGGKAVLLAAHFVGVLANSRLARHLSKREKNQQYVEEIQIPSVTELSTKHKVEFKLIQNGGGIRDIKFLEATEEEGKTTSTLHLPKINLEYDSEVILRNLVAYEAAVSTPQSKLEFTDYIDLMCGIVDTHNDIQILRRRGIIQGRLSDERIAEMFNGISRSKKVRSKEKSESQKAVEGVNKMVEKWENKRAWRRARRSCNNIKDTSKEFLKKNAVVAVKYTTYIFMVLLLALQIFQAYCEVYGCGKAESNSAPTSMSVI